MRAPMTSSLGIATGIVRPRRPMPQSMRLALVGVVAIIGVVGCGSSTTGPSAQLSTVPSVVPTATSSPAVTPTPTPTTTPKPATTPKPSPTRTATLKATPTARPIPAPKFVATGSMDLPRSGATATLLRNGKVLIAGGTDSLGVVGENIYASAELYDPATGRFTKTGSMAAARVDQTATLLRNGKVLIAGGYGCADPQRCVNVVDSSTLVNLASAELYDPTTGKFSPAGSMTSPRDAGAAALLPDGRVLLTEGADNSWAELYDPQSGKFTRTGKEIYFDNASATLLPNGKVLVTGGYIDGPHDGALYDESSGKFTEISLDLAPGTAPTVKYKGQDVDRAWPDPVTLLKDGHVLLFEGGYLVTYDPTTGKCAAAGFISPHGLWLVPTAALLPDGHVLFAGGDFESADYDETIANTAVVYDPSSGSQAIGSMKDAREYQTATLLPNGSVLIAGGGTTSAELFRP